MGTESRKSFVPTLAAALRAGQFDGGGAAANQFIIFLTAIFTNVFIDRHY
jgi:hypothetical protein